MRSFPWALSLLVLLAAAGAAPAGAGLIFSDGFEWSSTCAWASEAWYVDLDSDLFGNQSDPGAPSLCDPDFRVANNLDCDDTSFAVNPLAQEVCNGIDDDCDDGIDGADGSLLLPYCQNQTGVCSGSLTPPSRCVGGVWAVCTSSDYAQHSASYESNESLCDGLDNDCDGTVDEGC
jgi:hypothetical protein